ncbi:hypothetical protein FAGKG844_170056 [Frankia sp. AgKG'84/4]
MTIFTDVADTGVMSVEESAGGPPPTVDPALVAELVGGHGSEWSGAVVEAVEVDQDDLGVGGGLGA